ncbi:hypothetical protein N8524_08810 [Candidatus Puniceispirillum sp.]|nr:hypothetical protein [Candidatus Puniceispirillum sp.]
MKRLTIRRLHSVIAPKFLGDASVGERMKIVGYAGIGCCGGDGQAGFAGGKSLEMNEAKNRFAS